MVVVGQIVVNWCYVCVCVRACVRACVGARVRAFVLSLLMVFSFIRHIRLNGFVF